MPNFCTVSFHKGTTPYPVSSWCGTVSVGVRDSAINCVKSVNCWSQNKFRVRVSRVAVRP